MLTRIEVDGFKNLVGFSAEFGPFTCIAGPNAIGKSNLFDVIQLLSALAEHPLSEAANQVRGGQGGFQSARDLFWTDGRHRASRIRVAVEMVTPATAWDGLIQAPIFPSEVVFRYEIELGWDRRLILLGERLLVLGRPLSAALPFPHPTGFADFFKPSPLSALTLSALNRPVEVSGPRVLYDLARGELPWGQVDGFELRSATHTAISQYSSSERPLLLAVEQELKSWHELCLNVDALRRPDPLGSEESLSMRGDHLPAQFKRISQPRAMADGEGTSLDEDALSRELCARLRAVVRLRRIWVEDNEETQTMSVRAELESGEVLSARSLSDGTLRALALTLLELSGRPGLFCIEEPESSLHPRSINDLAELLGGIAVDLEDFNREYEGDPEENPDPDPVLRQVIVNTHSSELVRAIHERRPGDLLMATSVLTDAPDGVGEARALRLSPIRGTWRTQRGVRGVSLPVYDYLGAAAGTGVSAAEDR